MNISLDSKWERFIADKLQSGRFQSATEVFTEALRLLDQRERALETFSVKNEQDLARKLQVGLDQSTQGKTIPGNLAESRLRQRAANRRSSNG